jgi:serine phosphatase RsbU (regulator of sigma subunit)
MDLAAELQWSLLPPLTFSTTEVTVAGAIEPAYHIAGDTLDYAVDRGIVRAGVFDGMGHGLRSSQLATVAIAAYRNWRRANADLVTTARGIHDAMVAAFDGAQFTTALLVELASDTGLLSWTSAGHPPPLLLRGGRLVRELACRPTPPLGITLPGDVARPEPQVCREQLEPGDRVLLYTDGVLEARSPDGEFFGLQRLLDLLGRHFAAELPAPETMRRVVRALLEHQQGRLTDDATLLLLEWRTDVSAMKY